MISQHPAFTITDLKKQLGPGLGLRTNKYLLQIPVNGQSGLKINVLCRSSSLPERNIDTVTMMYRGRRHNLRAETQFPGTYEISVVDDSDMELRKMFDRWLNAVDLVPGSEESGMSDGEFTANNSRFGEVNRGNGRKSYQLDLNIWQLDANNIPVYGYVLKGAFPSSLGTVTLEDNDDSTMSEFSITISYSETLPVETNYSHDPSLNTTLDGYGGGFFAGDLLGNGKISSLSGKLLGKLF